MKVKSSRKHKASKKKKKKETVHNIRELQQCLSILKENWVISSKFQKKNIYLKTQYKGLLNMKVLQFTCATKSTLEMTWSPMWQSVELEEVMSSEYHLVTGVGHFKENSPFSLIHWLLDPGLLCHIFWLWCTLHHLKSNGPSCSCKVPETMDSNKLSLCKLDTLVFC